VVDADMRLVAWNRRYQQMFDYPDGMLYVGRPVADLIRWNAERGELGAGDIEAQSSRRARAPARRPAARVRARARNGQVIEMRGQALPGGGYVTSYSDITDYKRAERELREVNETLEQRVERTREAEAAQQSQDALPGRDQPRRAAAAERRAPVRLGAARRRRCRDEQARLAARGRVAARRRGTARRPAGRLAAGCRRAAAAVTDFDAAELLRELAAQYAPTAAAAAWRRCACTRPTCYRCAATAACCARAAELHGQRAALHRKAAHRAAGCACAANRWSLQVWDTGPGIPAPHASRSSTSSTATSSRSTGASAAWAWACRSASASRACSTTAGRAFSSVGRGSMFGIRVPRASAPLRRRVRHAAMPRAALAGLRVLCVDNDPEILDGMRALLGRWGVEVSCASTVDDALQLAGDGPEVLLVDYHLHDRLDGLDTACGDVPGALLTADGSDVLKRNARLRGYRVLTKPIKPASLRAFLASVRS
jgi:CheY-like chemotaxis protein